MIVRTHYRNINFNDERKWKHKNTYDDVLQVGKLKSIGYVCLDNLDEIKKISIEENKLTNISYKNKYCFYHVGDKQMMQAILDNNKELLIVSGWEVNAEFVFNKICSSQITHDENNDLYHLICDLFNSWCLGCEPLLKDVSGRYNFVSVNPYDPDQ